MLMAKKAKGFKLRQMRKDRTQKEKQQTLPWEWIGCSCCPNCVYGGPLSGLSDECRRKWLRSRDDTGHSGGTYKIIDANGREIDADD